MIIYEGMRRLNEAGWFTYTRLDYGSDGYRLRVRPEHGGGPLVCWLVSYDLLRRDGGLEHFWAELADVVLGVGAAVEAGLRCVTLP